MRKIWRIRESDSSAQEKLSRALKISPVTAQLLANRGIGDPVEAGKFLGASLASCHEPSLMKDMDKDSQAQIGLVVQMPCWHVYPRL